MREFFAAAALSTAVVLTGCASGTAHTSKEGHTMTVTSKIIQIPNERTGGILYGKLFAPADDARHPAIILSHGYNGAHSDFADDCAYFAKNGFVALAYDFAGGSTRSQSTGASTDMTLLTEKQDLLTVIGYASTLDCVDSTQLFLLGASQGGMVTALVAEEPAVSEKIRAIALYFPAFCIPDNWRDMYPEGKARPANVDFWGLRLGKTFIDTTVTLDVNTATGGFTKPVLIIHGTNDNIVPLSYAQAAEKRYADCRLIVLNGEGHGFSPMAAQTAREQVLHFMQAARL